MNNFLNKIEQSINEATKNNKSSIQVKCPIYMTTTERTEIFRILESRNYKVKCTKSDITISL